MYLSVPLKPLIVTGPLQCKCLSLKKKLYSVPVLKQAACISQYSGIAGNITITRSPGLTSASLDRRLATLKTREKLLINIRVKRVWNLYAYNLFENITRKM